MTITVYVKPKGISTKEHRLLFGTHCGIRNKGDKWVGHKVLESIEGSYTYMARKSLWLTGYALEINRNVYSERMRLPYSGGRE